MTSTKAERSSPHPATYDGFTTGVEYLRGVRTAEIKEISPGYVWLVVRYRWWTHLWPSWKRAAVARVQKFVSDTKPFGVQVDLVKK